MSVSKNESRKLDIQRIVSKYLFLILFVPLSLVVIPLLEPGLIIHGDFSVLDTGEYAFDKLAIWITKGSYSGVETLPRSSIIGFWYLLNLGGIDAEAAGKIMIILGFSVASFSFYFSFQVLLKNKFKSSPIKLNIAALIGSLIYAYNVWSFLRIGHWYLWIGYALLPIFLVSVIYSFRNPRNWKYILVSTFLWSFASVTPHMIIFYGIIFIGTLSVFVINNYLKKQSLIRLMIPVLSILVLYILFNFYWIYPVVLSGNDTLQNLGPQYVLTYEIGEILSRNSDFLNTLRLTTDWTNLEVVEPASNSLLNSLWVLASFVIPIVALSALLFRKVLSFALVFLIPVIIGIVLAMGTQSPANYYGLIFSMPFGWLFRDPDKWSFLTAFGYSFLAGTAVFGILNLKLERPKYLKKIVLYGFFALLIPGLGLYSYPIYHSTLGEDGKFSPILVPSELDKLNAYLTDIQTDKVFFMPYPGSSTNWSNNHTVESIYQTHSTKPNIMIGNPTSSNPALRNYYTYLEKLIIDNSSSNINNFIYPFGTSYVIYHNDTTDSLYTARHSKLLERMYGLEGLENQDNIGFFNIFRADDGKIDGRQQSGILDQNVVVAQGLDKLTSLNSIPSFSSLNSSVIFIDQFTTDGKGDIVRAGDNLILERNLNDLAVPFVNSSYILSPYTETVHHTPSNLWSKAGAMDPLHGEFHTYLEEIGIENWDFDYGEGLVITEATGASLEIPFSVGKAGSYDIFLRYMENQKGGGLKVYLDDKLIKDINTLDNRSNSFVWENIGPRLDLVEGRHTLALENSVGFNAVNIFAVVPSNEIANLIENAYELANKTRTIYLLEAESEFYGNGEAVSDRYDDGFDYYDFVTSFADQHVSNKYGNAASNGNVLVLSPGSEIFTDLDILKSSNYTLAVRANICEDCTELKASILDEEGNMNANNSLVKDYSNNSSESELEWLYLHDIDLQRGDYKMKIYSDSPRDLDLLVLYSSNHNKDNREYETLDNLFNKADTAAYMTELDRVDPVKYTIKISNASRPYVLSFAESFDPLWTASISDDKGDSVEMITSVPLFSIVNGFYIDRIGDYSITIEHRNQQLFYEGITISLITLILATIGYLSFSYTMHRINMPFYLRRLMKK